jgi:hypothetical protein
MRLRGEVDDRINLVFGQETRDQRNVPDIAMGENIARVVREIGQVGRITRVGERVEIDEFPQRGIFFGQALANEVGADKTAAAGDEQIHAR